MQQAQIHSIDGETVFGHGHVKDWLAADSVNTWQRAADLVLAYVIEQESA